MTNTANLVAEIAQLRALLAASEVRAAGLEKHANSLEALGQRKDARIAIVSHDVV